MADAWLTTLITATPQEGYELAIKLARMGSNTPSLPPKSATSCARNTQKTPKT